MKESGSKKSQAEFEFERRKLSEGVDNIEDGRLKQLAKRLLDGEISARQMVDFIDHSSAGTNALDRFVGDWRSLTPEQREQVASSAEVEIDRIATEAPRTAGLPDRDGLRRREGPPEREEEDLSDRSWLTGR